MDNRGPKSDQEPIKELQSPKARRGAGGHSEPKGIMRDAELGAMGGGSTSLHGNQRKPNGFSEPTRVSAETMRAKQMETGNTEYMDEMMAEQRENQNRNQMSRHRGGTTNPDDTSDKTA